MRKPMKTFIIILSAFFMFGCAIAPTPTSPVCPPEDVIINSPSGPLQIDKGMMIPENYWTIPEWEKLYEEYRRAQGL